MPKKIGLKNIIRVKETVKAIFSGEKPGVSHRMIKGVKRQKTAEIKIMERNKIFMIPLIKSQASFSRSLLISPVKTGIKAELKAPKIKRL